MEVREMGSLQVNDVDAVKVNGEVGIPTYGINGLENGDEH